MTTMTEEQVTTVDSGVRRQVLENRVMLLNPRVGCWEGRYKIPTELIDLRVAGRAIDASTARKRGITTPQTVMIMDDWPTDSDNVPWRKRFNTLIAKKNKIIDRFSIPFQMAGARIVPMANAREFFQALIGTTLGKLRADAARLREEDNIEAVTRLENRIQITLYQDPLASSSTPVFDPNREEQSFAYQWWAMANEFCRSYDDVLVQIRAHINPPEAMDALANKIPEDQSKMRGKFYCNVLPVELAGSGGQAERITEDVLSEYDDVVRDACNHAVESAIELIIERPREELSQAIAGLQDVINRDGRVSTKSFRPVYEAIEKLRAFRFAANDQIIEALGQLERRMGITTPSSLDSVTAANNGFSAALDSVRHEIENVATAQRDIEEFGREHRGFSFD